MNKKYKFLILILIIVILVFATFNFLANSLKKEADGHVVINGKKIFVEIADDTHERKQGLMFRYSLCKDCGMLFIFEEENYRSFWMKNTFMELDLIFLDSNFKVVDFVTLDSCTKGETCKTYISKEPAKYVLEVKGSSFSKNILDKKITPYLPY